MSALERELAAVGPRMAAKPRIMYLYDKNAVVSRHDREGRWKRRRRRLRDLADSRSCRPTGSPITSSRTSGSRRAKTEISIMLDSDAAPQPGWLEGLLKPFADPEIMAVGGFTVLGYDDFLSKTFALSWIFDLARKSATRPSSGRRSTPTIARCGPTSSASIRSRICRRSRSSAASGSATYRPGFQIYAHGGSHDGPCAAPRLQVPRVARLDHGSRPRLPGLPDGHPLAGRPLRLRFRILRREGRQVVGTHRRQGAERRSAGLAAPGAMAVSSASTASAWWPRSEARSRAASSRSSISGSECSPSDGLLIVGKPTFIHDP